MPLEEQFWGDFFGSCTDRFGVQPLRRRGDIGLRHAVGELDLADALDLHQRRHQRGTSLPVAGSTLMLCVLEIVPVAT